MADTMNTWDFFNSRWGDIVSLVVLLTGVWVGAVLNDKVTGAGLVGAGLLGLRLKTITGSG